MKSIKFQPLDWRDNKLFALLMVLTVVFIFLNLFGVWDFLGEKTVKYITAACYLVFPLYYFNTLFYRNHVHWNKRGITIRVNSFWGMNFSFDDVKRIDYAEDSYTVYKYNGGSPKMIDLTGIEQQSKERLLGILREYVG